MSWQITVDNSLVYDPFCPEYRLTKAKLVQELNKADSLQFAVYPQNPSYSKIKRLKSTIEATNCGEIKSRCRLLDDTLGWENERECKCEGELAFFNDSIQRPFSFPVNSEAATPADYLTFLVTRHNAQVSAERQFTVGTVTVTDPNNYISRSDKEFSTTWELIKEGLLEKLGGYLWIRHEGGISYLDYLEDFDVLANQPIRAGLNLIKIATERRGSEIATAILPLGALNEETDSRLTIADLPDSETDDICKEGDIVYSKKAEEQYGSRIIKVILWDDVTIPQNLLTKSTSELAIVRQLPSTVKITAADLAAAGYNFNSFSLGTYVEIYDEWHEEAHGLLARYLVKNLEINLIDPASNRLTLGATTLSMTEGSSKELTAAMKKVEANVTRETTQTIARLEQRSMSAIEQSEQQIVLSVSENYYTKGETNDLVSAVSTTVQQTADGIRYDFSILQQDVNDVQARADAKFAALQSYIQMEGGNITLGEIGNEVTLKIENDRIGIYVNDVAVTYWTANDFIAPVSLTIPVGGRLNLGNYAYIPRTNGSLDFIWVGN